MEETWDEIRLHIPQRAEDIANFSRWAREVYLFLEDKGMTDFDSCHYSTFLQHSHFVFSGNSETLPVQTLYVNSTIDCSRGCPYRGQFNSFCSDCTQTLLKHVCYVNILMIPPRLDVNLLLPASQFCRNTVKGVKIQLVDIHNCKRGSGALLWDKLSWLFRIRIQHIGGDECVFFKRVYYSAINQFFLDVLDWMAEGCFITFRHHRAGYSFQPKLGITRNGKKEFTNHFFPRRLPAMRSIVKYLRTISPRVDTYLNIPCSLQMMCRDLIVRQEKYRKYLLNKQESGPQATVFTNLFVLKHTKKPVLSCMKLDHILEHNSGTVKLFHPVFTYYILVE
jgi:hypothetical protein